MYRDIYGAIALCVKTTHSTYLIHHDIPSCFGPFCAIPTSLLFFQKIFILFYYEQKAVLSYSLLVHGLLVAICWCTLCAYSDTHALHAHCVRLAAFKS